MEIYKNTVEISVEIYEHFVEIFENFADIFRLEENLRNLRNSEIHENPVESN